MHRETYTLYVIGEYNKIAVQMNLLIEEIKGFNETTKDFQEQ